MVSLMVPSSWLSANYKNNIEVTLKEGTCKFGQGKVWNFFVPATPMIINNNIKSKGKQEFYARFTAWVPNIQVISYLCQHIIY
jgi:hypothetical protein